MEGGGEGGREEGYRKFTVDYSTFPGIVSEVVLLSALPPPLPISFSFSLFLLSALFPSLHRGKIRVNTGQDTPVCVSILTECKMEGGGEGGREEGYRKFTVDYSTFPGIVSEVVLLSALMCDVKAIAHVLKRCIKPCA